MAIHMTTEEFRSLTKQKESKPAKKRGMNRLESSYAMRLEAAKRKGEIQDWRFEEVTLKIGHRCRYTPDFFVLIDGRLEFHETKGPYAREDSIVKLKAAAKQFPMWEFFIVRHDAKTGFDWSIKKIPIY